MSEKKAKLKRKLARIEAEHIVKEQEAKVAELNK